MFVGNGGNGECGRFCCGTIGMDSVDKKEHVILDLDAFSLSSQKKVGKWKGDYWQRSKRSSSSFSRNSNTQYRQSVSSSHTGKDRSALLRNPIGNMHRSLPRKRRTTVSRIASFRSVKTELMRLGLQRSTSIGSTPSNSPSFPTHPPIL